MKPTKILIAIIAILTLLAFISLIFEYFLHGILWVLLGSVVVVMIIDIVWSMFSPRCRVEIERRLPEHFILGKEHSIVLHLVADRVLNVKVDLLVQDCLPDTWQANPEQAIAVSLQEMATVQYTAIPHRRGSVQMGAVDYALCSRFKLWWIKTRLPVIDQVKVLPDFSSILGSDLMSFQRWLSALGARPNKRRGGGQEFLQLRDFVDGDDIRNMDWKATAKQQKLIVRSYCEEHDRQIIFLLDCGRNMRTVSDGLSHFDHALRSLLLLSYTALKNDDSVGIFAFNQQSLFFLPAQKGIAHMGRLISSIYDLEPSREASDYETAITELLQKQHRRALIVILTHRSLDEDNSLLMSLLRLKKRHPIIFANLKQTVISDVIHQKMTNTSQALTYIGAEYFSEEEDNSTRQLYTAGIPCLNVFPKELSTALINHYLILKRGVSW